MPMSILPPAPLQIPTQLLGGIAHDAFGGPLDGETLRLYRPHFLLAVYRAPSRDLWVCVVETATAQPAQRGMATGAADLLGYYSLGKNRRGGAAFVFDSDFGAAVRASVRAFKLPPPPLPPLSSGPLLPPAPPPFIGVAGPVALTDATRRQAPIAFGKDLARYVRMFLLRPPQSLLPADGELAISTIYRWIEEVGVGRLPSLDRLRAEMHAEHLKDAPACGVIARRLLDAISTWESIHGDFEGDDEDPEF